MSENERTIKDICKAYGLSQAALSRKYDIPIRTVEDWHAGRRKPPAYVINMIVALLQHDGDKRDQSEPEKIRCENCEFLYPEPSFESGFYCSMHSGAYELSEMYPDDFCSYAKQKKADGVPAEVLKKGREKQQKELNGRK